MNNTFAIDIIPPNDEQRVDVLKRYRMLDTPTEKVFDNMTSMSALTFNTPVSLISLVDAETVFFKSTVGVGNLKCADRGESLCALAILTPEVMIFEDTLKEPVAAESAPVKAGARFYAGAPLKTYDGFLIGTLCVADFKPRSFSGHERLMLEHLALVVMEQMELRLAALTEIEKQTKLIEKKDEFISVASHELKTPMTSLMASLQLLERMKGDLKPGLLGKLIAQANKSLNKLNRLVGELLNVNRITSGQLQINKNWFKLYALASECCNLIVNEAQHELVLDGDPELEIFADEQKIEQVIVNLVSNAVKYAPESKKIFLSVQCDGDKVKISVRDEGPGIPAENLPYIFDRYYRSDYNQVNISGLGLGLYISADIVKRHRGEMGVISEPGKGSIFWFILPVNGVA